MPHSVHVLPSDMPDAAAASRPAVATLLVGVLDKVGTYGMIRFCLQLFPEASQWATPVVVTLAVISILYGAILAIGEPDMMRLIAFTVTIRGEVVLARHDVDPHPAASQVVECCGRRRKIGRAPIARPDGNERFERGGPRR